MTAIGLCFVGACVFIAGWLLGYASGTSEPPTTIATRSAMAQAYEDGRVCTANWLKRAITDIHGEAFGNTLMSRIVDWAKYNPEPNYERSRGRSPS